MASIIPDCEELLAEYVRMLRGLDGLLALLDGDAENIVLYDEDTEGDLGARIRALEQPKLLVYLAGIVGSKFPARMRVSVGHAIRGPRSTAVYAEIVGGTSTASGSDGAPMLASVVHAKFSPMELPSMERRYITFGDRGILEYWEIQTSFLDKGF